MTNPQTFDAFEVRIAVAGADTVVTVSGDVALVTAPTLEAVATGLVGHGHRRLLLDLGGVTFLDATGAAAIASISSALTLANGRLTARGASAAVQRVLDAARTRPPIATGRVAPSSPPIADPLDLPTPTGAGANVMSRDLVRAGAKPSFEIVDAALRSLTHLSGASVVGADGASVTLERNGRLATVAATNGTILRVDAHQYNTGEGPCLAAGAHGRPFYVESLAEEQRWPAFVPRAIAEGIASILSTPVTIANQTVGALNIYSGAERAFGACQRELADVFAAEASAILTASATLVDDQLAAKIAHALQSRELIALARGVLMAQSHITADEAAAALIRSARATEITVLEEAAEVIASASADAMPGHEPSDGA